MAEQQPAPFGPSPYDALAKQIEAVENAASMTWTNNVQQHSPESFAEAVDAWDEASWIIHKIEDAVEELRREYDKCSRAADAAWEAEQEEAASADAEPTDEPNAEAS